VEREMTAERLRIEDLQVRFGTIQALGGVSASVGCGEIVGLLGPNGAGKTTLFNAVLGTVRVAGGAITYEGADTTGHTPMKMFAHGVARTFQIPEVVTEMTVLENVMLGCQHISRANAAVQAFRLPVAGRRERAARSRALDVLDMLGLANLAGQMVRSLPLGRVRLVELARSIAAGPKLLLLDEIASGLSHDQVEPLAPVLTQLVAETGASILLVEHNVTWALSVVDRVYILNNGRLLTHGDPDEVRRDPEVIAAYLGSRHA
jgi:ABC-type branched-subunit amino acid transport system ATPase component